MPALLKWIQTPEADKIAKVAEQKAWKLFLAKYPNANQTKFEAQTISPKTTQQPQKFISKQGQAI